jgi:hypothetical protein
MWPWMSLHILLCVGIPVLIWWYSMLLWSCFQILSSFIRHEIIVVVVFSFLVLGLELWKTSRPNVVMTSIQVGSNSVISSVAWHDMAWHGTAQHIFNTQNQRGSRLPLFFCQGHYKGLQNLQHQYAWPMGSIRFKLLCSTPPRVSPCCNKAHCPDGGRVLTPTLWEWAGSYTYK